jgi:hypothetical protein
MLLSIATFGQKFIGKTYYQLIENEEGILQTKIQLKNEGYYVEKIIQKNEIHTWIFNAENVCISEQFIYTYNVITTIIQALNDNLVKTSNNNWLNYRPDGTFKFELLKYEDFFIINIMRSEN